MIPCVLPDSNLLNSSAPVIITVAGVGAELTKKQTPYLPANPDEILEEAKKVAALGAHVFHLHARDLKGRPTCDPKILSPLVKKIRKQTSLIVQVSTGGALQDSDEKRLNTLVSGSQMGSLTLGSVNFGEEVFLNARPFIEKLAKKMLRKKIRPELEIFDVGMVDTALELLHQGLLEPPLHFNIILGGTGWLAATEENLDFILKKLPENSTWSGSGVGRFQKPMIQWALQKGGHVRTGLEDNIYLAKGILAQGNGALVEQAIEWAHRYKRPLATPNQARNMLGINP